MSRRTNRRQFIKETAAAGLGFWVAGGVALAESRAASEKVQIACIGVGGKGSSDTDHAGEHGDVVALCDIDENHLNEKAKKFPKAKKYTDYRKMLDEIGKEIQAVTVSTPDHTHAVAAIMAMKMGKGVYCQKPLTHSVYEARQMRETAAQMKVATQMGNQGSTYDGLRRAVEVIQSGAIGNVREAHVWTNRPSHYWKQAPDIVARPKDNPPCPATVHWNEFLGPAPERPYNPAYHPSIWRGYWDFGTGALGDMGCHTANMAFRALKLAHPSTILAESGELNPETYPAWARITYQFPARDTLPPVKLVWYEGKKDGKTVLPPSDLVKNQKDDEKLNSIFFKNDLWNFRANGGKLKNVSSGSFLIGDKAVLFSPDDYGTESYIITDDGIEKVTGKPEKLPSNNGEDSGHKKEWIAAVKGGPKAYSNFDFAGMLTETLLLGNVAVRLGNELECKLGKKLEWDGPNLKVTNLPVVNALINPPYRAGWSL